MLMCSLKEKVKHTVRAVLPAPEGAVDTAEVAEAAEAAEAIASDNIKI